MKTTKLFRLLSPIACVATAALALQSAHSAQFVFDTVTFSNYASDSIHSYNFPWELDCDASAGFTVSTGVWLTVTGNASTSSKVQLVESACNGGNNLYADASGTATGSWKWSGKAGDAPAVALLTELSCSGHIHISGQTHLSTLGTMIISEAWAWGYAEADAGSYGTTEGDALLWFDGAQLNTENNSSSFSNFQTGQDPNLLYSWDTDYQITSTGSYTTAAGLSSIPATVKLWCEAYANFYALDPARAWGFAYATATTTGHAGVKLDQ